MDAGKSRHQQLPARADIADRPPLDLLSVMPQIAAFKKF
jgi:hypothetical protein